MDGCTSQLELLYWVARLSWQQLPIPKKIVLNMAVKAKEDVIKKIAALFSLHS